jgi:uncharacterized membrane protein YhaH (DUF805 family)
MVEAVTSRPLSIVELYVSGVGRIGRMVFIPSILGVVAAFEFYERTPWRLITGWAAYPVLICMAASVLSKRLHDLGRAGWWSALPIFAYPLIRPWPEGILGGIAFGIVLWYAAWLSLWPGEVGFNRFGERG